MNRVGAKNLVLNKIDTIFYPFIIWSVIQGSIEVGLSNYTNGNVTVVEVFSMLWEPRAQFWFLYALFIIFIVTSLTYYFTSGEH